MSADFEMEVQESDSSSGHKAVRAAVSAGRYLLALVGALIVSFAVFFVGIAVFSEVTPNAGLFRSIVPGLLGVCVGFFGVLTSTFIAPKKHRAFSPWVFTLAGCCFYVWLWYQTGVFFGHRGGEEAPFAPALLYLLAGGVCCGLYLRFRAFRRKRNYGG